MNAPRRRRKIVRVILRISRAVACCLLALLLTACLGQRSGRDREQTYAGGYAPYLLDIDEDFE